MDHCKDVAGIGYARQSQSEAAKRPAMPFADPTAYTKGQINRAGAAVRAGEPTPEALEIINNWRASHAYILNTFQAMLRIRTRHSDIVVAQRLKRLRTIASKLDRQPKMDLARMDDIAGCRLIFPTERALHKFRDEFHRARFGHELKNDIDKYDYIQRPKGDGYRGIHDIYEYNVNSESGKAYNGLLLELQYRTRYQHAWATTVEIIGTITEHQPKFHLGDRRHVEFFCLASEIIARAYERQTSCHPRMAARGLIKAFTALDKELRILQKLRSLNASTRSFSPKRNVILSLSREGGLSLFTYVKGTDALKKYFQLEQLGEGSDVVLVRGSTAAAIRTSYKNYFTDPNDFLRYVRTGSERLRISRK
jgi:hypothetical protein